MPIEIFKGDRICANFHRSDKRIKIRAEPNQEERDELKIMQRMINGSKCVGQTSEPVKIIGNGGITLLESGKLIMDLHCSSSRLGCEHPFQCKPDFARGAALDDMSQDVLRQGGDKSAHDKLVLEMPGLEVRIGCV